MAVIHISYSTGGGAGRAARRMSQACETTGVASSVAFVEGESAEPTDIRFALPVGQAEPSLGLKLKNRLQWEYIPAHRTALSNTLFSSPYPGVDAAANRAVETADIIHLHWPTWTVTPRAVGDWLAAGRTVFWTLHDVWPMTGGCHYPAGCVQYQTACLKCPQLSLDVGLAGNIFAEKRAAWGGRRGNLHIVTPSAWMADIARDSAILRDRPTHVLANPVELDVFRPSEDRRALRAAFGVAPHDVVLFVGSFDLAERRKGTALLLAALDAAAAEGELAAAMAPGAVLHLALVGKSGQIPDRPGMRLLRCGEVADDTVMADLLGLADLVAIPSLEDNYPNMIVEAMACGTPCFGFAAGGIGEMIEDGVTGMLAPEVGSVASLKHALLRFLAARDRHAQMRAAARATAEQRNDPVPLGARMVELYEQALGRPLARDSRAMRGRMLAAFARTPSLDDFAPDREFLNFPVNHLLGGLLEDRKRASAMALTAAAEHESEQPRIVAVRTVHQHHSARSGPYQFLRRLSPDAFDVAHVPVPLGADLAGEEAALFRRAGTLMGVPAFGQQGNAWLGEAEVMIRLGRQRADIVHFIDGELNGWLLPGLPPALFAGGRRPACVATYHQPPDVLARLVTGEGLSRFDAVVALCDSQAEFLARLMPRERVAVIPHGIDTDFFHPAGASEREDAPDAPGGGVRLLLVGHWLRDIAAARAACAALREAGVAFALTVVSPSLQLRGIDPAATFLSGLSDEELRAQYWRADALFLPLIDATANNAVLEAMACGLPVISTEVGGVPDAVGAAADDAAGILCPPGDAAALAAAVRRLADDPALRRAMGQAGRRRAEALDWRRIAERHAALYDRLLARRRRQGMPAQEMRLGAIGSA